MKKENKQSAIMSGFSRALTLESSQETKKTGDEKSWSLSPVRNIPVSDISDSPVNKEYFEKFDKPGHGEWESFVASIRSEGIHDPIIAISRETIVIGKKAIQSIAFRAGMIISGHRRKAGALEANLASVPVRWIEGRISELELERLMIRDNLERRQITSKPQKTMLLSRLYPDYFNHSTGGRLRSGSSIMTAEDIAKEQNISEVYLRKHKQKYKEALEIAKKKRREEPSAEDFIEAYKPAKKLKKENLAEKAIGSFIKSLAVDKKYAGRLEEIEKKIRKILD